MASFLLKENIRTRTRYYLVEPTEETPITTSTFVPILGPNKLKVFLSHLAARVSDTAESGNGMKEFKLSGARLILGIPFLKKEFTKGIHALDDFYTAFSEVWFFIISVAC
jgi:hypothetical protein